MKKLYLIDVSSLFFRAFYAIRNLNNKKGIPTNALYGFLAATVKLLKEHKPDGIAFCFDRPEMGFREEIYPEYKANRDEAPDDLIAQFPYLPILADALNIPKFDRAGFEADDLIGTLTKKCKRQGIEVIIVSGDKDFAQLVEPGVKLFDPAKDLYTDEAGVRTKFGVNPNQIIDYLALVGDASDNVPGVHGIGPKGAQKLLNEFETLDGIYKNLDKIKNERIREKLAAHKDEAYLSQKLCTIQCDMDLTVDPKDLEVKSPKRELLVPLLEELEFKSLLQRLIGEVGSGGNEAQAPDSTPSKADETVEDKVHHMIEAKESRDASVQAAFAMDRPQASVVIDLGEIEKAWKKSKTREIWFDVTSRGTALQIDDAVFRFEGNGDVLTEWINDQKSDLISGYDTKHIAHQLKLKPHGFSRVGQDVLLEAYCLGQGGDLDFPQLLKRKLGQELPEFAQPEERLHAVKQLSKIIEGEIKDQPMRKVLKEIEEPLAPVLFDMEHAGILIDGEKLGEFSSELLKDIQSEEKEICQLAGYDFNVGSPKQLGQVLFEKLNLPVIRKTKTGYSTDSDVLEKLSSQHPIAAKIIDWRELSKLRSTYVDALPRLINPTTGRVHTSFNQAVTSTGRLSSTQPNLQNIPIRTARGQRIRESFIAPPGYSLVSADYSQVELRILAHITGDPGLTKAFNDDLDIHTATASEVFGVKLTDVTDEQRRHSKAINFGIAYGMSDFGLAESLGIDRKEAADFIGRYFKRFAGVQRYIHDVVEEGKKNLFVETMFGRRRYYGELGSSNGRIRQVAERAAINMPIQGAAADLIKVAMINISKNLKEFGEGCMLLQVHDELIFQVRDDQVDELKVKVKTLMEKAVPLKVPLKVSVGSGPNWGEAH